MSEYVHVNALGAVSPASELNSVLSRVGGSVAVKRLIAKQANNISSVIIAVRKQHNYPKTVRVHGKSYPVVVHRNSSWEKILLATLAIAQRYPIEFTGAMTKKMLFGSLGSDRPTEAAGTNDLAEVAGMVQTIGPIVKSVMDILLQITKGAGGKTTATKTPDEIRAEQQGSGSGSSGSGSSGGNSGGGNPYAKPTSNIPLLIGGLAVAGIAASVIMKKKG